MTAQAGDTNLSPLAQLKRDLRARLRRQRAAAPQRQQAARKAARRALCWTALRRARHVAIYLPVGSELDTAPLLKKLAPGRQLYLPRLGRCGMRFVAFHRSSILRKNRHDISEPVRGPSRLTSQLDVILLPLVGFDRHGTRLGAGGGHYDRALEKLRSRRRPLRVGYAYGLQQCDELPREAWDLPLHAVITEKEILRWPTG